MALGVGTGAASPGGADPSLARAQGPARSRSLRHAPEGAGAVVLAPADSGPARGRGALRGMARINFWASSLWARWEISTWLWAPPRSPGLPGSALPSSPPLMSLITASRKSEPGIHSQHGTGARPISQLF